MKLFTLWVTPCCAWHHLWYALRVRRCSGWCWSFKKALKAAQDMSASPAVSSQDHTFLGSPFILLTVYMILCWSSQ